jgi:hypothetical protein
MRMGLKRKLFECGVPDIDPVEFREVVCEMHRVMHPTWTVDELRNHPGEYCVPFVACVCRRFGRKIPEHVVMGELLNARKDGAIS